MTDWVHREFGVEIFSEFSAVGLPASDLLRLALRRNPRRAHLLVSTVLAKHIPTEPRVAIAAGALLGVLAHRALAAADPTTLQAPQSAQSAQSAQLSPEWLAAAHAALVDGATDHLESLLAKPRPHVDSVVLGFAETATGLGHLVSDALDSRCYLHSTRRTVPGIAVSGSFEEGHSHASTHKLLPIPADLLHPAHPLVLVDDEMSTGATALNTIRELHRLAPRTHYVIASLVDMRAAHDRARERDLAAELGVRIDSVALARGSVALPDGLAQRVTDALRDIPAAIDPSDAITAVISRIEIDWPAAVPDGGRHGFLATDRTGFESAISAAATTLTQVLRSDGLLETGVPRVLVLGHEETMHLPLALARELQEHGIATRFQTTTRSPVHPVDDPDYPIRWGTTFPAADPTVIDDPQTPRFVYNAGWSDRVGVPAGSPDAIVLVVDTPASGPALDATLSSLARKGVPVYAAIVNSSTPAQLPDALHSPEFGSYPADEVSWLLKDLSHVELEADITDRERRIQSGIHHYAESLPIEFQPDAEYLALFDSVLEESAVRLARAVGLVTEVVLAERGADVVLASLARAGTPIGLLMRRWALHTRGVGLPHYAVSIVRDRGIDPVALKYLAHHHDPAKVVFVDGWTGKGAITRELDAALREVADSGGPVFNPDLAVLADPGFCARTFGTRDDFLIASACLNSTVSGLVSRTVLNDTYIGARDFHGAKFYAQLSATDRSITLVDRVQAEFDTVAAQVAEQLPALRHGDREPTWAGWDWVEQVREAYGIASANFVKPGVGETTRVLLRRVPWRILIREESDPDLQHIQLLAAKRGVPVEIVPEMAYSCMGLIKELA